MNIPKIIHMLFSSYEDLHPKFKENIENIKRNHKDWKFIFFTDNDIHQFIKKNYDDNILKSSP